MENPFTMIYWDEPTLWTAAGAIILTPIYWILVSLLEYRTHILRRIFCSRHVAVFIFSLSLLSCLIYRNVKFLAAVEKQKKWSALQENPILWVGHTFTILGLLLVVRSFLSLGYVATFMGDYFGLPLRSRVEKFPYSWMNHPMYAGSFFMYLGVALVDTSQAGLLLAMLAGLMYLLAAWWEEPFTDYFYTQYPKSTRTVGVQVSCSTQILEIASRTVATQVGQDVEIVAGDPWQREIELDDRADIGGGAAAGMELDGEEAELEEREAELEEREAELEGKEAELRDYAAPITELDMDFEHIEEVEDSPVSVEHLEDESCTRDNIRERPVETLGAASDGRESAETAKPQDSEAALNLSTGDTNSADVSTESIDFDGSLNNNEGAESGPVIEGQGIKIDGQPSPWAGKKKKRRNKRH